MVRELAAAEEEKAKVVRNVHFMLAQSYTYNKSSTYMYV